MMLAKKRAAAANIGREKVQIPGKRGKHQKRIDGAEKSNFKIEEGRKNRTDALSKGEGGEQRWTGSRESKRTKKIKLAPEGRSSSAKKKRIGVTCGLIRRRWEGHPKISQKKKNNVIQERRGRVIGNGARLRKKKPVLYHV